MTEKAYLAVDMGASSGRHVLGLFDGSKLRLEEVYRFENGPVEVGGSLYWDLLGQWTHVRQGLRRPAAESARQIASVGVDTWGVDFGLLGRGDELLGNPYHYRDGRTNGMMEQAFDIVPREEIFRHTGLQFMQLNTLYQLLAMKLAGSPLLDVAETLLMVPDLFHWLLTGREVQRDDRGQHDAVLQSDQRRLGDGAAGEVRPAHAVSSARSSSRGPTSARCGRIWSAETGLAADQGRAARLARHGQRRDGRAGGQPARASGPTGATSAWAPGP